MNAEIDCRVTGGSGANVEYRIASQRRRMGRREARRHHRLHEHQARAQGKRPKLLRGSRRGAPSGCRTPVASVRARWHWPHGRHPHSGRNRIFVNKSGRDSSTKAERHPSAKPSHSHSLNRRTGSLSTRFATLGDRAWSERRDYREYAGARPYRESGETVEALAEQTQMDATKRVSIHRRLQPGRCRRNRGSSASKQTIPPTGS